MLLPIIAIARETDTGSRPLYASHLIKVKLSPEATQRAQLPQGLYAEASGFGINELDQVMSRQGGQKIIRAHRRLNNRDWEARTGFDRWFLIELDGRATVEEAIAAFRQNRYVETAIPEYIAYPTATPNDTYYTNNWGHNNTAQLPLYQSGSHSGAGVGTVGFDADMQLAWDQSQGYGSSSIIIAIIDSGVDTAHEDLRLVTGYDYGDNDSNPMDDSAEPGHGTCCAGITAGKANNGIGIAGVAGGCSVMPLKVANTAGAMNFTAIDNAITHAADNGADVISMSLGIEGGTDEGDIASTDAALEYAYGEGVVIFAATANANTSAIAYPSNHNKVISVGAASPSGQRKNETSSDGEYWWGSNYGINTQDNPKAVDIMAPTILPATDITGSGGYESGNYDLYFNGTSCATPYAAGVAALILSKDPTLTPAQVWNVMKNSATDMTYDGGAGWDRYTGYGMVNAYAALNPGLPTCTISSPINLSTILKGTTVSINVTATDSDGTISRVEFYVDNVLKSTDYAAPYSWSWLTGSVAVGQHTLKAIAYDNSGKQNSAEAIVMLINQHDEGFESANFSTYPWINNSTSPWIIQSTDKYAGTYAAKSGTISHSQTTNLSVTLNVTQDDAISFFSKVSSELGYDYLRFYIDDVMQGEWSGETAWSLQFYPVTAGLRTFRWTYSKDGSETTGSDCAWLDNIAFPPYEEYFAPPQNLVAVAGNNIVNLTWSAPVGTTPTAYLIYKNSSYLTTTANLSYTDNAVINGQSYQYYLIATYTGGQSEATSTVTVTPNPVSYAEIGSGTAVTGISTASPINIYYKSLHGQSIYTKAELNAAGIIGPANITALGFYVATAPSLALPNFIIRMKHTSATNMSAWQTADGLNTVYTSSSYLPTAGAYDMLTLSTPFIWNGVDNILVDTAFSLVLTDTSTGTIRYSTVTNGYRYIRSDSADQTSAFSGGYSSNNRPNIRLSFSQIPSLPIPFAEGFESGLNNWQVLKTNQTSYWTGGTATFDTGTSAAYITNNGSDNNYTLTASSVSHLFRDLSFPSGTDTFKLRFVWKGQGQGAGPYNDYLRVFLINPGDALSAGTELSTGQLGSTYNLNPAWTEVTLDLPEALNGLTKRLVFSWRNDSSSGTQPPAAVDNIRVVLGDQSDAAVVIDNTATITPPPVTIPGQGEVTPSLEITDLEAGSTAVIVTTGYDSIDSPYENAGLDLVLSGAEFTGTTLNITHNLGFIPQQLAYRLGEGAWNVVGNPGDWGTTTAYFSIPAAKAEGDLYIAFTNSSDGTLPLTLSAFQANIAFSGGVQLNWISATETGLLGYYLFRSETESLENAALITELIPGSNTSTEQHYTYRDQEVLPSTQYYYWLQGVDLDGWVAYYGPISIVTDDSNGPGTPEIPLNTALIDNVPNPFNPETAIRYSVDAAAFVELEVYNSRGQLVRSHRASHHNAGYYTWYFDGRDEGGRELSSGVYYYRMTSDGQRFQRRMLLLK
jgi:subtilisin family serine protease